MEGSGRTRAKMVRFLNFLRKLRNRLFGVEELKSELAAERKASVRATNLLHRAILENRRAIGAQHFGSPEADGDPNGLATAEKQIYSQFGEDGIIDHYDSTPLTRMPIPLVVRFLYPPRLTHESKRTNNSERNGCEDALLRETSSSAKA